MIKSNFKIKLLIRDVIQEESQRRAPSSRVLFFDFYVIFAVFSRRASPETCLCNLKWLRNMRIERGSMLHTIFHLSQRKRTACWLLFVLSLSQQKRGLNIGSSCLVSY